jgi:hypothetical protein
MKNLETRPSMTTGECYTVAIELRKKRSALSAHFVGDDGAPCAPTVDLITIQAIRDELFGSNLTPTIHMSLERCAKSLQIAGKGPAKAAAILVGEDLIVYAQVVNIFQEAGIVAQELNLVEFDLDHRTPQFQAACRLFCGCLLAE